MTTPFIELFIPPQGLIAHRGASAFAPENTLIAFDMAIQQGATWIELDVMLTHDEELIVYHDNNFKRILQSNRRVAITSYADIADKDAGSWFDAKYSHARIPTLTEVIHLAQQTGTSLNIEIKLTPTREAQTVDRTLSILNKEWRNNGAQVLISSFSIPVLTQVAQYNQQSKRRFPLALLTNAVQKQDILTALQLQCVGIHSNQARCKENTAERVKQVGLYLACYTVNDKIRAHELFAQGVTAIFSDYPRLMDLL